MCEKYIYSVNRQNIYADGQFRTTNLEDENKITADS